MTHLHDSCRSALRLRGIAWVAGCCAALAIASGAQAEQRAKIEAIEGTVISTELSGRIASLPFRPGDAFDKGDELAELDCTLYHAERDRVSAQLQSARKTLSNRRRLAELRSIGKLEVDLAELAVRESSAELRIASINVKRCSINAPFSGRVVKLHSRQGQSVKAQEKLMEIVGRDLEARVIVPARWLSWIAKGQGVELAVEETGESVSGQVTRIGAAVDPVSHTIPVWASLKESTSLRPGMSGVARFPNRPDRASSE